MKRYRFNSYDLFSKRLPTVEAQSLGIRRTKLRGKALALLWLRGGRMQNWVVASLTRIIAFGSCAPHDKADDTGSAHNGIACSLPPLEVVWLACAPGPLVFALGTEPNLDDLALCDGLPASCNCRAPLRLQKHISNLHEKATRTFTNVQWRRVVPDGQILGEDCGIRSCFC